MSHIQRSFLSLLIVLLVSVACVECSTQDHELASLNRSSFPAGFIIGTASSAYQYEGAANDGGRGPSIWDTFTQKHPERIKNGSNGMVAIDSYHRYKEDVALMKDIGLDAYRFSISWSRILPHGNLKGGVNPQGIAYYNSLINELVSNGLQPFVTLFHWDLPQALEDEYGGFLHPQIVKDFRDYADLCYRHFGDRVKNWITINEPLTFTNLGYASGAFAPGRCSKWISPNCTGGNSGSEPYTVSHHLLLAHAAAVKRYRTKYQKSQKGQIGIALNGAWVIPLNMKSKADQKAASRSLSFSFGWFLEPLKSGSYPADMVNKVRKRLPTFTKKQSALVRGSYDFLGLNYYSSNYASHIPCNRNEKPSYLTDPCVNTTTERNGVPIGPKAASDWHDSSTCPAEENVEAICQFFNTIGKRLDESPKSRRINDMYFSKLKELTTNPQLAPRLRFMVRDVLELRANNWVPRREEVKAKTITEIHSEAEKNLGLRPGATASIRNNRGNVSGAPGATSPGGFPINRPGTGGMMPGMPGTRKMPGMPGIDNDNWEVPRTRSMPRGDASGVHPIGRTPIINESGSMNTRLLPQGTGGLMSGRSALLQGSGASPGRPLNYIPGIEPTPSKPVPLASAPLVVEKPLAPSAKLNVDQLRRKTVSLLEEYFNVKLLDEALMCVEELKAPTYHPEVVKEAISVGLEKSPPCVELVAELLEYLFTKEVITARDIETGCLLYGALLDDIAIDLPKAPNNFGEIIGQLVLAGGLNFKVVNEILKKMEDEMFRNTVFNAAMRIISSSPSGQNVLNSQSSDIKACESLL